MRGMIELILCCMGIPLLLLFRVVVVMGVEVAARGLRGEALSRRQHCIASIVLDTKKA